MDRTTADSISPATKAWFGNQIQSLAMRHDLAGPNIRSVNVQKYGKQLVDNLRSRARSAADAKELQITTDEMDNFCRLAAEELIRIRQIRAAHKNGELPVGVLRQLPVYQAFPDYFEGASLLVSDELIAIAQDLFKADKQDDESEPPSQPGHPKNPVSEATRDWMEFQALGLACADDAWGAPFGTVPQEGYITNSTLRIRRNARRAIGAGLLQVPADDIDNICWVAACEAYLLRSLRAAIESGELTLEEVKRMPMFVLYREYFENESSLVAMAERLAAAAGLPIPKPDPRN